MTDEEFILKYLERDYRVRSDNTGFHVYEKGTPNEWPPREFVAIVLKVLGNYRVSETLTSREIVENWISEGINKLITELVFYLHDCSIQLGHSEWHVYKGYRRHYQEITLGNFQNIFQERFSKDYLRDFYTNWHMDKVTEKTMEIMNL